MRHKVAGRLFGRTANQRKALLRGLVTSLFEYQRIETTVAKAKAIKGIAEKLVTFGKRGDLHAKRMVFSYIPNRAVVAKLFAEIAPRFADRNGGYLRIIQTRQRVNDRAPMAIIEFVDYEAIRPKPAKKDAEKKAEEKKTEKKVEQKTAEKKPVEKKAEEAKPAEKKSAEKKTAEKAADKPKKETKKAAEEKPKKAAPKAKAEAEDKAKKPAAKKTTKKEK
jgi:large subunit ribosomal protein L17